MLSPNSINNKRTGSLEHSKNNKSVFSQPTSPRKSSKYKVKSTSRTNLYMISDKYVKLKFMSYNRPKNVKINPSLLSPYLSKHHNKSETGKLLTKTSTTLLKTPGTERRYLLQLPRKSYLETSDSSSPKNLLSKSSGTSLGLSLRKRESDLTLRTFYSPRKSGVVSPRPLPFLPQPEPDQFSIMENIKTVGGNSWGASKVLKMFEGMNIPYAGVKNYPLWLAAALKRNQRILMGEKYPSKEMVDSFTIQECESLARKYKLKLFESIGKFILAHIGSKERLDSQKKTYCSRSQFTTVPIS